MNVHQIPSPTPGAMIASFWQHRHLIMQMTRRDIASSYRGSIIGMAWTVVNPLLMLAVYTFVFSVIFKARFATGGTETRIDFALNLFAGLVVFRFFSELVNQSPKQIVSNRNYVKKVVFPLEILSWVSLGSVLFRSGLSLMVLLLAELIFHHSIPWTALYFPIVVLPLIFVGLGVAWFLAALGVYIRDISQITTVFTTILMYLSAVFYPVSALPEGIRPWLRLNPVMVTIAETRKVLLLGGFPDWQWWVVTLLIGILLAFAGFWWFQKTRNGFADVL